MIKKNYINDDKHSGVVPHAPHVFCTAMASLTHHCGSPHRQKEGCIKMKPLQGAVMPLLENY